MNSTSVFQKLKIILLLLWWVNQVMVLSKTKQKIEVNRKLCFFYSFSLWQKNVKDLQSLFVGGGGRNRGGKFKQLYDLVMTYKISIGLSLNFMCKCLRVHLNVKRAHGHLITKSQKFLEKNLWGPQYFKLNKKYLRLHW